MATSCGSVSALTVTVFSPVAQECCEEEVVIESPPDPIPSWVAPEFNDDARVIPSLTPNEREYTPPRTTGPNVGGFVPEVIPPKETPNTNTGGVIPETTGPGPTTPPTPSDGPFIPGDVLDGD